jgi:hypothetical protein
MTAQWGNYGREPQRSYGAARARVPYALYANESLGITRWNTRLSSRPRAEGKTFLTCTSNALWRGTRITSKGRVLDASEHRYVR